MNTDTRPNGDARQAFEAWARSRGYQHDELDRCRIGIVGPEYYNANTEETWKAWQAALAASRTSGEAGPTAAPPVTRIEGVKSLRTLCDQMLDVWDDGDKPVEYRAYVEGAFREIIEEIRAALASQPQGVSGDALGYIDSLLIDMKGRASSADPFVVSKQHLRELRRLIEVERASAPQGVSLSDERVDALMGLVERYAKAYWDANTPPVGVLFWDSTNAARQCDEARAAIESELRSLAAPGQEGRADAAWVSQELFNIAMHGDRGNAAGLKSRIAEALAAAAPTQEVKDVNAEIVRRIYPIIMDFGGDWPDCQDDHVVVRQVKWAARMLKEYQQSLAHGAWQPIATAPKEGSFLALDEHGPEVWAAKAYWDAVAPDASDRCIYDAKSLTHWARIPPVGYLCEGLSNDRFVFRKTMTDKERGEWEKAEYTVSDVYRRAAAPSSPEVKDAEGKDAERLAFMANDPVRMIEGSKGMFRVYEDRGGSDSSEYEFVGLTSRFYPTVPEAIDAAIASKKGGEA